ncbi:MAG TPA: DUF2171 domain-containing protein [Allosphingosinicella sp.]|nr:DUF2171 domain-containing protein [Allosphingosinicella sp.]
MAYNERDKGRFWGRETQWRGDQGFGAGWGNQTARPPAPDDLYYQGGGFEEGALRYGGPGFGGGGFRSAAREFEITRHDPRYIAWRDREVAALDRDYDDYVRENQTQFDREFGGWRARRGEQRAAIGTVKAHMEVVGADGGHVGTVDCTKDDRIILTKGDRDAGGIHHAIPCGWIESVGDKVVLNLDAAEAQRRWQDEHRSRALFERDRRHVSGPHVLNRSFAGTYRDEE